METMTNRGAETLSAAPSIARSIVAALEPWYDWGGTFIERLDGEGEGPGRWFSLQWFGLSITVFAGRMPSKREG